MQDNYTEKYTPDFQTTLISMLLSDPDAWAVCSPYFKPDYFDDNLNPIVRYIIGYDQQYGNLPSEEQINSHCGTTIEKFSEPAQHTQAAIDDFGEFVRYRAMENAILDGVDLVREGKPQTFLDRVHEAFDLSLSDDDDAFEGLWIDECSSVEPPEYMIRPWLVKDTVSCAYGPPGSGKSFFLFEAAYCLATGTPFAGQPVKHTNVMYVAAEGEKGMSIRLEALAEAHGLQPHPRSIRLITQPLNLLDDDSVTRYIRYTRNLQNKTGQHFGLHVFDTYSQCISGADENSQATASKASSNMIRIRRELECTVVYVHHTGKDIGRGMRGSDALRANTDGAVEIVKDENGDVATATLVRAKDAPTGGRIRFRTKFQKVPRLAGHEFDGSLVLEFVQEVPIKAIPLPDAGHAITWQEDLLSKMKEGDVISVAKALTLTSRPTNTHYKSKLAELVPLNKAIDVTNGTGDVIGRIGRQPGARADNQFGDIICVAKSA